MVSVYPAADWTRLLFLIADHGIMPPTPTEPIGERVCLLIANALSWVEPDPPSDRIYLESQILQWRSCGGYKQQFIRTKHQSFVAEGFQEALNIVEMLDQPPVLH